MMTIDDLSTYLKIAKSTLYKLAQEGKLPGQSRLLAPLERWAKGDASCGSESAQGLN